MLEMSVPNHCFHHYYHQPNRHSTPAWGKRWICEGHNTVTRCQSLKSRDTRLVQNVPQVRSPPPPPPGAKDFGGGCRRTDSPCNDLARAVRKSTSSIVIVGKLTIRSPGLLTRDLVVKGVKNATITSFTRGSYAFIMTTPNLVVRISDISFVGVGVLKGEEKGKLFIYNTNVSSTTSDVVDLKKVSSFALHVPHSSFHDTGCVVRKLSENILTSNIAARFTQCSFQSDCSRR